MTAELGEPGDELDDARLAQVEATLGSARLHALLDVLRQRLKRLPGIAAALPDSAGALRFLVHQGRGSAASLGLVRLARGLDALETILSQTGADTDLGDRLWGERIVEKIRAIEDDFESGYKLIEARRGI